MQRGGQRKEKSDGSKLPENPPRNIYLSKDEKIAYKRIASALKKTSFSQGCDLEAVVLGAQRLAHLEELRRIRAALPRESWFQRGGNNQLTTHPLFNQLARAERDWASSQRALLLTVAGRSSTRLSAKEMLPHLDDNPDGLLL